MKQIVPNKTRSSTRLRNCLLVLLVSVGIYINTLRIPVSRTTANADVDKHGHALVIVMGRMRGDEKAWQSLYRNVLDVNNADLAIITFDIVPPLYQYSSLFTRAKFLWKIPEYEDWTKALDVINGNSDSWREPLFDHYGDGNRGLNTILGGIRNVPGQGAIVFSFRYFLSQYIRELDLTSKYERFVVTRPDHYYLCNHDLKKLNPQYLWVPRGEDFQGVTDRHVVASSNDIFHVLNILPPLLKKPSTYIKQLSRQRYNHEKFLLHRWAEEGLQSKLRRFDRMMFVTVHPEEIQSTAEIVKEGVLMKYRSEYDSSRLTCYFK